MKKYLLSICLIIAGAATAQNNSRITLPITKKGSSANLTKPTTSQPRDCGTMENLAVLLQQDPTLKGRMAKIEAETQQRIADMQNNRTARTTTVNKIAVVVHVVYSNSTQNISDAQIATQIAVLNKDYRKLNSDANQVPSVWSSIAADIEIEFCLANKDPNGIATTGITRTATNNTAGFSNQSNDVKASSTGGIDAWNTAKYLNLWVCDLQGLLLGYAQFPGGPANTDGVVIDYAYFGTIGTATYPFDLGRTATHEVGHYLNLFHIWGDESACTNDDLVSDTPLQMDKNTGCPTFPETSGAGASCTDPNGSMFQDYMDYTDDRCMFMFTNGQKSRMIAALTGTRASLLTNTDFNCSTTGQVLSCDTIANYNGSNQLTVYRTTDVSQPGTGFIAGTNSFDDIGFAEKFTALQPLQNIYGALIGFGYAYGFSNATLNVKVWKANGAGGNPGTVVATQAVALSQIITDINASNYTSISFANPVAISSGGYYIGIEFDNSIVDSIALYTTINGQVTTGKSYEEYGTGVWYPFTDATNSWGVNVALAIAPLACINTIGVNDLSEGANDIQIFPNPSNGTFTVASKQLENKTIEVKVYNSMGALVLDNTREIGSENFSFDLSQQANGLYLVEMIANNKTIIKKISIIH